MIMSEHEAVIFSFVFIDSVTKEVIYEKSEYAPNNAASRFLDSLLDIEDMLIARLTRNQQMTISIFIYFSIYLFILFCFIYF